MEEGGREGGGESGLESEGDAVFRLRGSAVEVDDVVRRSPFVFGTGLDLRTVPIVQLVIWPMKKRHVNLNAKNCKLHVDPKV